MLYVGHPLRTYHRIFCKVARIARGVLRHQRDRDAKTATNWSRL